MRGDERQLRPAALDGSAAHEVLDTQEVQVQALEREQREEQPALTADDEPHEERRLRGILLEEADRVDLDVGILADPVRVGVVAGVLRVPPAEADSHDAGGEEASELLVRGTGGEDLLVRRLVGQERGLREQDAQRRGDEQLEPAVAQQDEAGDGPTEREGQHAADDRVEALATTEEAGLPHELRHLGVRVGQVREGVIPRAGGAHGSETGVRVGDSSDRSDGVPDRLANSRCKSGDGSQRRVPIADGPDYVWSYAAGGMRAGSTGTTEEWLTAGSNDGCCGPRSSPCG